MTQYPANEEERTMTSEAPRYGKYGLAVNHKHLWRSYGRTPTGYPMRQCSCGALQVKINGRWKGL